MAPPHVAFSDMVGKLKSLKKKTGELAIVDVIKTGREKTIQNVRGIHGEAERRFQHLGRETEVKFSGAIHGLGGAVVNIGRGIQERGRRNVDRLQEPPSDAVEIADVPYQVEIDAEDLAAQSAYTTQGSFFDGVEPENCWDQEAMSYDIRQAGLAGGLNFGAVTNGGLTFEEAFAYEQSESPSSIDPGDLERTYSTDGSLGLGDDIDNQGNPTPASMGYLSPVNEPPPQLQDDKPQFSNNMENPYLNRRFLNAAWAALKKLRNAANQEGASPQLREFVGSLGDLDSVVRLGLESLKLILDGKTPSRLSEVYCFLHVAYAISRAKKTGPDEDLPSEAFRKDLQIFRRCLSSVSDVETGLSDQDIFDEIVEVMWKELQEGLEYINSMLKKKYSSDSEGLSPQPSLRSLERHIKTGPLQQSHRHHVSKTYRRSPSSSPLFKKRSNPSFPGNHSTSVLHYLKVTVEDVKNTTIFKELVCVFYEIGKFRFLQLFLTGESSSMVQYIVSDKGTEDIATSCMFCADPKIKYHVPCGNCLITYARCLGLESGREKNFNLLFESIETAVLESTKRIRSLGNTNAQNIVANIRPGSPSYQNPGDTLEPQPHMPFIPLVCPSDSASEFIPPDMATMKRKYFRKTPYKKSSEKNFMCSVKDCKHGYTKKQSLDQHTDREHSGFCFEAICGICGVSRKGTRLKARDNMRAHMIKVHNIYPARGETYAETLFSLKPEVPESQLQAQ